MSQIPSLAVPPLGALDPLRAMEEYLPEEWHLYLSARRALEAQQKAMRSPPGGHRWPENDPRYIAPILAARQTASRGLRGDVGVRWREVVGALLQGLQCGALHAYAVPASQNEPYLFIPIALWQQLITINIRGREMTGLRPEPVRLLICRADERASKAFRSSGRPPADARELFEAEFKARGLSGARLGGAHKEAAAIFHILQETHPGLVLPQEQTAAKWIRQRMKTDT